MLREFPDDMPTIVTLCGSSKFVGEFEELTMHLSLQGIIVISLGLFGHADQPIGAREITKDGDESEPVKQALDRLHFFKIDLADAIMVVNPRYYLGNSTKREIHYARRNGKRVMFLEPCPYDTDGDGDCGRRGCPYCAYEPLPRRTKR